MLATGLFVSLGISPPDERLIPTWGTDINADGDGIIELSFFY
jgi:hypothetical protein